MTNIRPTIDYTNKDYASLRRAMLDLARLRLPEWTDQTPSDMGMLLIDLFAYMGDVVLYYQDRIANESFLHTAVERRSALNLLRLIGYELRPPVAATADLMLTFKAPPSPPAAIITIPAGAQFSTKGGGPPVIFEYLGADLVVDLNSDQVVRRPDGKRVYSRLPVRHSQRVPVEIIGSSTGEPHLSFPLSARPLILESLLVEVNEGAGWVRWDRRESLLYDTAADGRISLSSPEARDYYVQYDENDVASVCFGDSVYGRRPPVGANNVRATYRVGGGVAGNVAAALITQARTALPLLDAVTNPLPAAGGADHESLDHAVQFGPLAFRSGQRAVTLDDYVALAHQAGGVAKVRARSRGWNQVELFIAPEGNTFRPVPEDLKRRLVAFFEDRRMAGTFVQIRDPAGVPIDLAMDVIVAPQYRADAVRQSCEASTRDLLAYQNVDFGQPLYLSDLYARLEAVPGVHAVTVTRFRRQDATSRNVEEELRRHNLPMLADLPEFLRRSIQLDVSAEGRIDVGAYEIPVMGQLDVRAMEAPR